MSQEQSQSQNLLVASEEVQKTQKNSSSAASMSTSQKNGQTAQQPQQQRLNINNSKNSIKLPGVYNSNSIKNKQSAINILNSYQQNQQKQLQEQQQQNEKAMNPFTTIAPLPQSAIERGKYQEMQEDVFMDYLKGELSPRDFLAMRNFPRIYENLPEPKKVYLQMLKYSSEDPGEQHKSSKQQKQQQQQQKQQKINDNSSQQQAGGANTNNNNGGEPQSPVSSQSSKFSEKHEEKLRDILDQKMKSVAKKQKFTGGQQQQQQQQQNLRRTTSFNQMLQTRMSMAAVPKFHLFGEGNNNNINNNGLGSANNSCSSRVNRKRIQQSLKHLRQVIRQNIEHRRNQQEYLNLSGSPEQKLQQLEEIQQQQAIRKRNAKTSSSSTKFLSNLNQLTNDYQSKLNQQEQQDGGVFGVNSGKSALHVQQQQMNLMYSNKQLRNISIIHELKGQGTEQQLQTLKRSQPKDEFSTQRPLYKKFFDDNANQFVQMVREPFSPQFRQSITRSDEEYQKLLHRYLFKCDVDQERLQQKIQNSSKLTEYMRTGMLEQRDQIEMRKKKPENIYLQQISDLDAFQKENMIESLLSNQKMLAIKKKYSQVTDEEIPNRMRRARQNYSLFSMNNKSLKKNNISNNNKNNGNKTQKMLGSSLPSSTKHQNQNLTANNTSGKGFAGSAQEEEYQWNQQQQQAHSGNFNTTLSSSAEKKQQLTLSSQKLKTNASSNNFINKQPQLLSPAAASNNNNNAQAGASKKAYFANSFHNNNNTQFLQLPPNSQQQLQLAHNAVNSTRSITYNNNINNVKNNNNISSRNNPMGSSGRLETTSAIQQQQQQQQQESQGMSKLDQRLEQQKKKGYFVIRRNQRPENNQNCFEDMVREESDDSKDASMTEAILELLYSESLSLQKQLVNNNSEGIIKKIKHLIKLEELKKNAFEANTYKLEHR